MSEPGVLSVCLFGTSIFRIDGAPRSVGISGATRDLFHYLLIHSRREVRREYLADLYWGRSSPSRQRSALNFAVWRIHRQIGAFPGITLHSDGGIVRINSGARRGRRQGADRERATGIGRKSDV